MLWIARSGALWCDLPERFAPWNTVYRRFGRWAQKGVWQRVLEAVQDPGIAWPMLDSTGVRAHQHAAGQKKQRPDRSPRPFPLRLALTPG
ncbi:transposase [Hymenobacter sp. BT507]|uniref:Transposase n=1 Tax=Hymenobacter citatus TaxID=2763506 RepID=A0ABR7MED1_9BACT|nr:transposase [Hymenobacter citatus]